MKKFLVALMIGLMSTPSLAEPILDSKSSGFYIENFPYPGNTSWCFDTSTPWGDCVKANSGTISPYWTSFQLDPYLQERVGETCEISADFHLGGGYIKVKSIRGMNGWQRTLKAPDANSTIIKRIYRTSYDCINDLQKISTWGRVSGVNAGSAVLRSGFSAGQEVYPCMTTYVDDRMVGTVCSWAQPGPGTEPPPTPSCVMTFPSTVEFGTIGPNSTVESVESFRFVCTRSANVSLQFISGDGLSYNAAGGGSISMAPGLNLDLCMSKPSGNCSGGTSVLSLSGITGSGNLTSKVTNIKAAAGDYSNSVRVIAAYL